MTQSAIALIMVLVPVITALTSAVKMAVEKKLDISNSTPLVAISLGVVVGAISVYADGVFASDVVGVVNRMVCGALAGLGSVGLYEVFKDRTPKI